MTQTLRAGRSVPESRLSKHLRVELWAESNYITGTHKRRCGSPEGDERRPRTATLERQLFTLETELMDLHSSKNMKIPRTFRCSIKVGTSAAAAAALRSERGALVASLFLYLCEIYSHKIT